MIQLVGKDSILPDDVSMLVYTEAFIYETLRLFPVVPILGRILNKDVNLGKPKPFKMSNNIYFGCSLLRPQDNTQRRQHCSVAFPHAQGRKVLGEPTEI